MVDFWVCRLKINAKRTLTAAELALRESIRINPDFGGAHESLGDALDRLGRPAEAATSYSRAVEIDAGLTESRKKLEALAPPLPSTDAAHTS